MPLPTLKSKQVLLSSSTAAAPYDVVSDALFNLVHRLSTEYKLNWQSADLTTDRCGIHCLAMGILSCLNVSIQKISRRLLHQQRYLIRPDPSNMLQWRQWPSPQVISTVSLGKTQIIFPERIDLAVSLVDEHLDDMIARQSDEIYGFDNRVLIQNAMQQNARWLTNKIHYAVTSIREIQYFTKTYGAGHPRTTLTPVIPFLNGTDASLETGVRWCTMLYMLKHTLCTHPFTTFLLRFRKLSSPMHAHSLATTFSTAPFMPHD
jgi:hypothetical protein